ncbi:MAG: hypothetical protein AAGJ81_00400 [Verrucomicrobiota bacterium]
MRLLSASPLTPKLNSLFCGFLLFAGSLHSEDLVVVVSGGFDEHDTFSEMESFLRASLGDVAEVRSGDFSNFYSEETQAALEGADLVVIARTSKSKDYADGVGLGYNTLSIPVVVLSSYIARSESGLLGWYNGTVSDFRETTSGSEVDVTEAGIELFGGSVDEKRDWHESPGDTFNAAGLGDPGDGEVLAEIEGGILVARWRKGDAPGNPFAAGVDVFPGERLFFALDNDPRSTYLDQEEFVNLTPAGREALVKALLAIRP